MTTTGNINLWIEVNKKAEACGLKVTITDMHFAVLRLGELLFDSMELYDVNVFLDGYTEGEKWARQ